MRRGASSSSVRSGIGPRGERHEVEHAVEPLVAALVDAWDRPCVSCDEPSTSEYRRALRPAPSQE